MKFKKIEGINQKINPGFQVRRAFSYQKSNANETTQDIELLL